MLPQTIYFYTVPLLNPSFQSKTAVYVFATRLKYWDITKWNTSFEHFVYRTHVPVKQNPANRFNKSLDHQQ